MCAEGDTFLADSEWLFGGTAASAGACYATMTACTQAGFMYSQTSDGVPSSALVDSCNAQDGSNLEMSRGVCDSIGGHWDATTCQAAKYGLDHAQSTGQGQALSAYCTNPMLRHFFETALAGCCSAGNIASMDTYCGDLTVAPTAHPLVPDFCDGGSSMVSTALLPFDDGTCSIPDAMATACRDHGWSVRPLAIEGRSECEEGDATPELKAPECVLLLGGEWLQKTCGQWETEMMHAGPAGLAAYCAADPTGRTKLYVDIGLLACCPAGTAAEVFLAWA